MDQQTKTGILQKNECVAADATTSVKCTFWSDDIQKLNLGQSYLIKNIDVRLFGGEKVLTTTPDSSINLINDIGAIKTRDIPKMRKTIKFELLGVTCSKQNNCSLCSRDLGEFNAALPTVKCQNSGMTQKTGPIKPKYKCEFVASYENNTRRLILLDGPLRTHDETTTIDGVQAIEQFFMENSSNIKAEINANETHILKLISFD